MSSINYIGEVLRTRLSHYCEEVLYGSRPDIHVLRPEVFIYFDKHVRNSDAHNCFFEFAAPSWIKLIEARRFYDAQKLWEELLTLTRQWESQRRSPVHKGTPFYFWAVTSILTDDLDKGFLLMHQALVEDQRTSGEKNPPTPAHSFVCLDAQNQRQFFKDYVDEAARFLADLMAKYREKNGMSLCFDDFVARFLQNTDLEEIRFYFVYVLCRTKRFFDTIVPSLTENIIGSLMETGIIFDLCLTVENTIKIKNNIKYSRRLTFIKHLGFLATQSKLSLSENELGEINSEFNNDFENALNSLLTGQILPSLNRRLNPIEEDLVISYGFRNLGAHSLESYNIIFENFEEIIERVINSLFFTIEKVY